MSECVLLVVMGGVICPSQRIRSQLSRNGAEKFPPSPVSTRHTRMQGQGVRLGGGGASGKGLSTGTVTVGCREQLRLSFGTRRLSRARVWMLA